MKQSIIQFEQSKMVEKLDEEQLEGIKGGGWWEDFWAWIQSLHQGCPPEDDHDDE